MLRLLGVAAADPAAIAARAFMHTHGGALYAPSWAKFWLAVLGVYDWEGINSMPVGSSVASLSLALQQVSCGQRVKASHTCTHTHTHTDTSTHTHTHEQILVALF
jgi:squalene cyclase